MAVEYLGLSTINGPLVVLEGVRGASYDEIVEMTVDGKEKKLGRIIEVYEDKAVIQVFEGTEGMALRNTHTRLTGHPMELAVSEDMLGRTFNGIGQPIDDLGDIRSDVKLDVNGKPLNPVSREYPRNYIRTGISAIDCLTTLIRGQKLPIFSGNGLPHDQLAAQIVQHGTGSVTQIPILTMPNDDITHPIPDLTGYITEGQIVLDRNLHGQSVYPPINVLPSLSRLMKDGIGEGYTRKDHQDVANQLFSCYAKVGDARALASVIGEDELSPLDKTYLSFGREFERRFVGQSATENRSIIDTLSIGWELLRMLPREELDRIDTKILDQYYAPAQGEAVSQ